MHSSCRLRAQIYSFGLVQKALGRKQLNSHDIAGGKARLSMTKATARGIQCRLTTCQCIKSCIVIAQGTLCISQCRQHSLFITQRGLPLRSFPSTYLCAHTAAVEQSPRDERHNGEARAGRIEPVDRIERLESATGTNGQLGKQLCGSNADIGGAGSESPFSGQNIGAATQDVGAFPYGQCWQDARRRGGVEQLQFPFRGCAEQDTKTEYCSALTRLNAR